MQINYLRRKVSWWLACPSNKSPTYSPKERIMTEKKCSKCGEWKLFEEFHKDKTKKDGREYRCRACKNESDRKKYKEDPEKHRKRTREYREANPEKCRESKRKHYEANREKENLRCREYRKANPDKVKSLKKNWCEANKEHRAEYGKEWRRKNKDYIYERNREWAKANPEIFNIAGAKRRALKKSTITTDPWELQQITSFYTICPKGYHVDHIVPLAKGGRHELANLQHLEGWLNLSKKDKHPDDWDDPRPISCRA